MPITITLPLPDSRIGPGLQVGLSSDFVGPMPSGSEWKLTVATDAEFTHQMWIEFHSFVVSPWEVFLLVQQGLSFEGPRYMPGAGTTIHLQAELINGSSFAVEDSGVVTGVWEPTAGLGLQIAQQAMTTGGLTVEEHDAVLLAAANTQLAVPTNASGGVSIIQTIGQVLGSLGNRELHHRHASMLISGQGSIARGSGAFRSDAMGIEWYWNTIPPGFGYRHGSVAEYFNRIVQFRLIKEDGAGLLYQDEVLDVNAEGQRFAWGLTVPVTLEWYVTPGCVVLLYFTVVAPG